MSTTSATTTCNNNTQTSKNDIPILDLSLNEADIVKALMDALTTIGFATLVNHGVVSIERTFEASKAFFDLPLETKLQYQFVSHDANRGYIPMGSETLDLVDGSTTILDHKESLEIGKEGEAGYSNQWATELSETCYKTDLLEYFQAMDTLHLRLMRLIAIGLRLPDPDYLVRRCDGQHENLRLLHYPSLTDPSLQRANIHADYGTITLVAQDSVGGLKVQRSDGKWIFVQPIPGALVLNVGDMLMRWSNDVMKATLHQVVSPPTTTTGEEDDTPVQASLAPERYSVVFFCNANKETLLECLETCCGEQNPPKYPPINSHKYITQRLSDTITK